VSTLPDPLVDGKGRRVTYLRLSLTDRCNYRCTYCMPESGVELSPRQDILTFEEIAELVACFARLGVTRVRLTGGEPTVRQDVVQAVARVAAVPGIRDVAMTTNGHRLCELAAPLAGAGLHRLNVSVDTLDPARFRAITRRGDLARVLAGIEAARAASFAPIKINAVALRGFNDDELGALCEWAWQRGCVPRFIEWMPMSDGALFAPGRFLSAAEVRTAIERQLGVTLRPDPAPQDVAGGGPARYYRAYPGGHPVGTISALSEHFCDTCNRVRVSATGQLHTCLARDASVDLRTPLRMGGAAAVEGALRAALGLKREGHEFTQLGRGAPRRHMVAIGG
jgi:cyclic pyranopterin phosphate synthase